VVWTSKTRVLVDAGKLKPEYILGELKRLGLARIDAILVTHAHTDHIDWTTYELASERGIPIYCNRTTWGAAKSKTDELKELERSRPKLVRFFDVAALRVGDLTVRPFAVPHEGLGQRNGKAHAGAPVGFVLKHKSNGRTYVLGYATDLGCVPVDVVAHLADSDVLIIEANHCEHSVQKKRKYHGPWVLSDVGHLSNYDAGGAIVEIMDARSDGGRPLRVLLAHISKDHNTGSRALSQVRAVLKDCDVKLAGLHLTYQDRRSRVVEVGR
jgi:phosphoribosyl 1,2-cyclic phosphodiesterase